MSAQGKTQPIPPVRATEGFLALTLPWLLTGGAVLWLAPPTLYWDDWDLAAWWLQTRSAGLDFQALWPPHNEHRIVLSKLLFYGTAEAGWGPVPLMFLSFLLTAATFWLLAPLVVDACAGLARGPRMLFLLAFSAFFSSWVQWQNFLMGSQVAWSCAMFGILMALRGMLHPPGLVSRCGVAAGLILAYLSSSQWVVLIPLLLAHQGLRWWQRRLAPGRWLGLLRLAGMAAVLAAMLGFYLWGLERPPHHASLRHAFAHPLETLSFLQIFWGNPFAVNRVPWSLLEKGMGVLFFLATYALIVLARKRRLWRTAPRLESLALSSVALAHGGALLIAIGRVGLGPDAAAASRYTSFMLVGWLAMLCTGLRLIRDSEGEGEETANRRRTVALAGILVLVPLGLGVLVSAGKLYRVATWHVPERTAGSACLEEVLANPSLLPSRRACLQALYPDPERLYRIARALR